MIKDIVKEGPITLECLIARCERGKTAKNTPYLSLALEDSSGTLDAKFWNLTEEMIAQYTTGMVVEAHGDILFHRNAKQLRVRKLIPLEGKNVNDYVQNAPMSKTEMEEEIMEVVLAMKNEMLQKIVLRILDQKQEEFYSYPAATKNHHNFVGGLAYHTLCMLHMAKHVVSEYTWLDADLLYAGVLLHDVGKTVELSQPVLPEYTMEGNLLGHISIMASYIDQKAREEGIQDEECVTLLKHMILSHHGKMEFGSPVLPMIPEAEVLNLLDNLDSRLYMMKQSLEQTKPGQFGPRVFALENRMIYRKKGEE
ncbi:3'-5' exoribonuclease YhaM family protein [Faecalicoccus pleomorphus]|uniref:3'-5' exoribonuclease YhaM family protein n=1 Tax=Faecalicoccus pleomorphus TaxID=1323 RepID=UPI0024309593|nr:HD domain-containing protein [Faecalicoccus pleomorphus]MDM8292478.1 HD domain-containing protein [Faecalicoccus pleomorphus]